MALPTGNIDATDPGTILSFDGSGFDATRVISPTVVWDGSRYVMLYAGLPFGNNFQIGLATSVDGTTWTPHSSDPVISNAASQPWGAFREIPVSAVYENGTYKLWFYGDNSNLSSDPGFGSGFGLATSTDAINWTWNPGNPIRWEINAPQGNGFNLTEVVKLGGQYHAYFTDQDPAGDVLKHAVSADGITFSGDAQLTLPTGYQLRAATTARDGNTEYVLAVLESGGVQHYGTSLDGVNFTIQGTTDLPSAFGTGEILVKNGQVNFFGTVGVGNVNWPFGNAVIQTASAELEVSNLRDVTEHPLMAAAKLADSAYDRFRIDPDRYAEGWNPVSNEAIGLPTFGWSYSGGVFEATVPLLGLDINAGAHLYESRLNDVSTLSLSFRGTDEPSKLRTVVELIEQGAFGWERIFAVYHDFLERVISYAETSGVDQILVTGHSLGGALTQKFLASFVEGTSLAAKTVAVTFGSPGSEPTDVARLSSVSVLNVVHDDDYVPVRVPARTDSARYGDTLYIERPEGAAPAALAALFRVEHRQETYLDTASVVANGLDVVTGSLTGIGFAPSASDNLLTFSEKFSAIANTYTMGVAPRAAMVFDSTIPDLYQRQDIILGSNTRNTLSGDVLRAAPPFEANDDILWGGPGNAIDTLLGIGGNDTFYGGDGADIINGFAGIDTAVIFGLRDNFVVSPQRQQWIVRDLDGNVQDRLTNVELVRFDDAIFDTRTGQTQPLPSVGLSIAIESDFPAVQDVLL